MEESHPSSIAIELIHDIRSYQEESRYVERQTQEHINRLACLKCKSDNALSLLNNSEDLRKALFFIPNSSSFTPEMPAILEVWLNIFPGLAGPTPELIPGDWLVSIFDGTQTISTTANSKLHLASECFRHFVKSTMFHYSALRFLSKKMFWRHILTPEVYDGTQPLSLEIIYNRLLIDPMLPLYLYIF
jgi:hypothetical protein